MEVTNGRPEIVIGLVDGPVVITHPDLAGLSAPGEGITSLGADSKTAPSGGTSVAAPFVTGAIALVWSEFSDAGAGQVRVAVTQAHAQRRPTVVPALLNAWATYVAMREFRSMQLMR
jgi:subtilisin family serine protease